MDFRNHKEPLIPTLKNPIQIRGFAGEVLIDPSVIEQTIEKEITYTDKMLHNVPSWPMVLNWKSEASIY